MTEYEFDAQGLLKKAKQARMTFTDLVTHFEQETEKLLLQMNEFKANAEKSANLVASLKRDQEALSNKLRILAQAADSTGGSTAGTLKRQLDFNISTLKRKIDDLEVKSETEKLLKRKYKAYTVALRKTMRRLKEENEALAKHQMSKLEDTNKYKFLSTEYASENARLRETVNNLSEQLAQERARSEKMVELERTITELSAKAESKKVTKVTVERELLHKLLQNRKQDVAGGTERTKVGAGPDVVAIIGPQQMPHKRHFPRIYVTLNETRGP